VSKKNVKVTGGRLCGEIRYEADTAPYLVVYCHCKMCQKGVANLFATAAFFKQADFRYIGGDLSWYEAESADRGFCPLTWRYIPKKLGVYSKSATYAY
jgi:hypothetical protein